jgi:superoxide reductase
MEVYKCELCGNIVEMLHEGAGELVCCGEPMVLFDAKTMEEGTEKHKPVIEKTEQGIKVKVGDVPHPMMEEHFIEWIELIADGVVYRNNLKPGDSPEAVFCLDAENIWARAYCNIHGIWKN